MEGAQFLRRFKLRACCYDAMETMLLREGLQLFWTALKTAVICRCNATIPAEKRQCLRI